MAYSTKRHLYRLSKKLKIYLIKKCESFTSITRVTKSYSSKKIFFKRVNKSDININLRYMLDSNFILLLFIKYYLK